MLFNSLDFLIFFPVVVLFYFIIPQKIRYLWLLAASYYFYMCWNAKYALLMLFSTAVTYFSGLIMEWIKNQSWDEEIIARRKKACVSASFFLNLAVLFFFKYSDFALDNLNRVLEAVHIQLSRPSFDIVLPVGISFYTFQALSYTMDVYRDEIYAEKNFFRYALFVSFFPQLVAGPIERSKNLLRQLAVPTKPDFDKIRDGLLLMLWGYFLKLVLADRIAIFVDTVYGDYGTYGGWYLITATLLFAVQIYCDFSGYSVIAMGTARILGIDLMENFNAPYFSQSVSEFWRRWHISLSSWFRDYLYIPLGGSRKGTIRKYINVLIVFLVSGLWHGASWSYVVWGGLNGMYQVAGEMLRPLRIRVGKILHLRPETENHRLMNMLVTFLLVDFSWIFFRAERFRDALKIIKSILTVHNPWVLFDGSLYECGLAQKDFTLMVWSILLLFVADIFKYRNVKIHEVIARQEYWFRWLLYAVSASLILLVGIWGTGYNAANFIYFQF